MNQSARSHFTARGRLTITLLSVLVILCMTVGRAAAATPPAPTPISPANGANVQVPFTISWSAVSDPSGITAYNWQVSPSSSMAPVIQQGSTNGATQATVSGLATGTYFWSVQAVNGAFVQGVWSAPQSFKVTGSGTSEPGTPTLNPPNGYNTFHPMEVFTFTWNSVPGAATYQLDFATDPNFPIASEVHFDNIPSTTYSTEFGDSLTGNFYARVRAVSSTGILGVPSNLQTFSVLFDNPLPPPPNPLGPANGATVNLPVILSWTDVPNPQPNGYVVEVAKDSGFLNIEYSLNQISGPSLTITSLTAGTKYWHVLSQQGDSAPGVPANTAWSKTQSFTVPSTPPHVSALTLASTTPSAGFSDTATIQLSGPAPSGGAVVGLTSSDPNAAPVPASVSIPAGNASGGFRFTIGSVTTPTPVTLTASLNGSSTTANLTVEPPALQSLSISSMFTGGFSAQLTVMLSGNAPSTGAVVSLSSSSAALTVPATVTVQAGSPSAVLNVNTSAVTANTLVTITATYNGASLQAQTTLTPQIAPTSLTLSPTTTGSTSSGSSGTVTIASPAPSDTEIFLTNSNPSVATIPTAAVVPQGSTTGGFSIQTNVVTATTTVTITATGAGVSQSAVLTIVPSGTASSAVTSLVLNPAGLTGGSPSQGTVLLLSAAPSGGLAVTLSSSSPSLVTVPAGITVPAGATSAGFNITTSPVTTSTNVNVTASGGGGSTFTQMTLSPANPLVISSLTLSPTSVTAGNSATGTVTLSAAAPAGGESVPLSSSNVAVATTPTNVVVPAGATSATFTVSTSSTIASLTTVAISGSDGGATQSANLSVSPSSAPSSITISSLTLSKTSITGGNGLDGTITLSAAAPSGGIVVPLSTSNSAIVSIPASVTIPAGSNNAKFKISTQKVSANTSVTISASLNGFTKSSSLTVTVN